MEIKVGDKAYFWSAYDFDRLRTASPFFLCEECGEFAQNLIEQGYCFSLGYGALKEQWLEYLWESGVENNPAVNRWVKETK